MTSPTGQPGQRAEPELVAPVWHTVVLLLLLVALAWASVRYGPGIAERGRILLYLFLIAAQLTLLGLLVLGLRRKGILLREIVGGRWAGGKDAVFDLVVAGLFWVLATLALGGVRKLIGLTTPEDLAKARESLAYLFPRGALEFLIWVALSVTVGVVQEIVFRGYLLRQCAALTRSPRTGVLLQAVIFGVVHGSQSARQVVVFAAYGILFGLLAVWRRSLRPGMIAHAWQDIFSGFVLRS